MLPRGSQPTRQNNASDRGPASRLHASDVDVLQFRVAFHRRHAEVAAEAALLEAAEGRFDVDAAVGVDAQHAALDRPATRSARRRLLVQIEPLRP